MSTRNLRITIGNKSYDVTVEDMTEVGSFPTSATPPPPAPTPGPAAQAQPALTVAPTHRQQPGEPGAVISPMAGAIKSILVEAGASVTAGQSLIVLEAMKMENQIVAPMAGTVKRIDVKEGDSVRESQVLLVLE
jgi:glutaconyl-CoA decarboxylase